MLPRRQREIIKYSKLTFATLALSFSAFFSATAATTPPKVVFIGDYLTYYWASAFAANPNWINKGSPSVAYFGATSTSQGVLAAFQADVASLHPAIVHILIGQGDSNHTDDASFQLAVPYFLSSLEAIMQEARAANIQVILGMEPSVLASGQLESMNSVIASYGTANNIPVINYGDALCGCIGSRLLPGQASGIGTDTFQQYGGGPYLEPPATSLPFPNDYGLVVTAAGYSLMTQMAEATINTLNPTLKSGWLQNVQQANDNEDNGPTSNVNTVAPGAVIQFTPVGVYSDGSQHPLLNTSFQGSSGTWTSSNPLVMYVSQTGLAWANSQGTAIGRYTSPGGVNFSEWIMNVNAPAD
jgi:hypothetical protein